jgi:hypothetical protein
VILFTRSLSRVMGYRGQFGLYGYYVLVAWLLRTISPPLATMAAQVLPACVVVAACAASTAQGLCKSQSRGMQPADTPPPFT